MRAIDAGVNARVSAVRIPSAEYADADGQPTVPGALRRLGEIAGWSTAEAGTFGGVIPQGARVLVKPNWVMHENGVPYGLEPLVTHPSLIRAVTEEALRSPLSELAVGDAPLQQCNFE
jgi:uncharacterized protein (DUF362 family)